MTANELKYEFDIRLREVLKALNIPFTTNEINRFFNEAQLNITLELAKQFEKSEEIRKALSNLVVPLTPVVSLAQSTNHPNGRYVTLATNILKVVEERANVSIHVKPVTLDQYIISTDNPFKQPSAELFWRLDIGGKHELITDGTVITSYNMVYLKYPQDIDIDNSITSELAETVHNTLVNEAVNIAKNVIMSQLSLLKPQKNDRLEENTNKKY
jgi:hypothetical protein